MNKVLQALKNFRDKPKLPKFKQNDILINKYQGNTYIIKIVDVNNLEYAFKYIKNDIKKQSNFKYISYKNHKAIEAYYTLVENVDTINILYGLTDIQKENK